MNGEEPKPGIHPRLLRVLLAIEFFLALPAVYLAWAEIGGQSHLDLIPWEWKLVLGVGLAGAAALMTRSAAMNESAWNRGFVLWFLAALVIMLAMGGLTYYHHLHENDEPLDEASPGIEKTSACGRGFVRANPCAALSRARKEAVVHAMRRDESRRGAHECMRYSARNWARVPVTRSWRAPFENWSSRRPSF